MVAISADEPEESRSFAERYGIWFPLLSDPELEIAKQWVGVNDEGFAIPGLFILERGGRVVFRKIGERKDDRLYGADLLATLDRVLGAHESQQVAARGGFEPAKRSQLRLGVGGGGRRARGDTGGATEVGIDGYYFVKRLLLLGVSSSLLIADESRLALGASLKLRTLHYADLLEAYVSVPIGAALVLGDPAGDDRLGLRVGVRTGIQFAWWPSAAPFVDIGVLADRFRGQSGATSIVMRLGVAWLP